MSAETVQQQIQKEISENAILLYVKGSPQMPMCGFSKGVMDVFTSLKVPFKTIDVLSDPEIREGIKLFTQWPTIPQVFIKGEFIGGYDIVRDLHKSGELLKLVQSAVGN